MSLVTLKSFKIAIELKYDAIELDVMLTKDNILIVPFAGSGSECVAARKLGVKYIGYEINPEYVELCNKRLDEIE